MSYDPRSMPSSQWQNQQSRGPRPARIAVLGVLNLIWFVLGGCGMAFTAVSLFAPPNPDLPNPVIEQMQANDSFYTYMIASLALGTIATLVLGLSGVGLLMGQGWGRTLAIGYSVYGILAVVVGLIVNWIFVFGPMMERVNDAGPEQQGAMIGGMIGGSIGGCCGMIYPIILLCLLLPEKIKLALD